MYHLAAALPVGIDLAFSVDLLDSATPLAKKVETPFFLTRESLKRNQIDGLWRTRAATAPRQLANALLSDAVVDSIRRRSAAPRSTTRTRPNWSASCGKR